MAYGLGVDVGGTFDGGAVRLDGVLELAAHAGS